jgi:hypothetical protein
MRRTPLTSDLEPRMSPLSRTVECQGQLLHIDIFEDGEGGWSLAISNEQQVATRWTESFPTEQAALDEAMKTIEEEGPEGFAMDTPYRDTIQ